MSTAETTVAFSDMVILVDEATGASEWPSNGRSLKPASLTQK